MTTFRTLGATNVTETRTQNTAAQAVVHNGRSSSGVDEFGGSAVKSGAIRSNLDTDGQKSRSYRHG